MKPTRGPRAVGAAALFVMLFASPCGAATLTVTGAADYHDANSQIAVDATTPTLLKGPIDADFESAFNSWNDEVGNPKGWTLIDGGDLGNDTRFTVRTYTTIADGDVGRLRIQIDYTPGAGAPAAIANAAAIKSTDAVWSQSIFTNQKLGGSLPGNPYLDNPAGAGGELPPPAYPFQYDGTNGAPASSFFDQPGRPAVASWEGVAYLSQVDYVNKELIVYDGVEYGFTVSVVPEPASVVLLALGTLGLFGYARRRQPAPRLG